MIEDRSLESLTVAEQYRLAVGELHEQSDEEVRASYESMVATLQRFVQDVDLHMTHTADLLRDTIRDLYQSTLRVLGLYKTIESSVLKFTDRLPSMLTRACQEAFRTNRPEFVRSYLRLVAGKPTPERVEALWHIIGRRRRRVAEIAAREPGWRLVRYLRGAIARKAHDLWYKRVMRERIHQHVAVPSLEDHANRAIDPEVLALRQEDVADRWRVIAQFLADRRRDSKQQALLRLLLADRMPAEAVRLVGGTWSTYQSLQRALARALRRMQAQIA